MTMDPTINEALSAYDAFLSGDRIGERSEALARRVALAAAFGAAAYEHGIDADQGAHAMVRAVLLALTDPANTDLDYLRQGVRATA